MDLKQYTKIIGTKSNIHKVSCFLKNNPGKSRFLVLDFEFSANKIIYEIGGLIIENGKLVDTIFEEYSLPKGEPVWDFKEREMVVKKINKGKKIFSDNDKKWLFDLIDSVDYIVMHNYVAEAQCLHRLEHPGNKYNINDLSFFKQGKFICTFYTFSNQYFKKGIMKEFNNDAISKFFGWKIKEKDGFFKVSNKDSKFQIKIPNKVRGEIHNAFYDSVITLTNFISATKLLKDSF